jgi:hypothetical protein
MLRAFICFFHFVTETSQFATHEPWLQPLCDPNLVTVICERRHDTVLAELQAEFTVLKTFVFTPTRNPTPSTQIEKLSNRAVIFQRRLYPLFRSTPAVFLLAFLLRWELIQTKEVDIEIGGDRSFV